MTLGDAYFPIFDVSKLFTREKREIKRHHPSPVTFCPRIGPPTNEVQG